MNKTASIVVLLLVSACAPADDAPSAAAGSPGAGSRADAIAQRPVEGQPSDAGDPSAPGGPAAPSSDLSAPAERGPAAPRQPGAVVDLPAAVPSSEANAILARAERAYSQIRSMEADFTQAVYVPLLDSTQNSRGRLFHRSPDRFLMRFSDPQGDVIVADGRYIWMYYPSTDDGQVMRAPLAAGGQQVDLYREFLADATNRYAASLDGSEAAGGRSAKALTLIPRQPSGYRRVRIWVDDQDSLVRRFEISEENGSVRRLELTGLRVNGTLSDALFQFTPPAGVQVHDF